MEMGNFVPVYVPAPLVATVYGLIGDYMRSNGLEGEAAASPDVESATAAETSATLASPASPASKAGAGSSPYVKSRDADPTWPDALLRQAYEESPSTMKTVLDVMADRPDEKCTTAQFTEALGFTGPIANWRFPGVIGAFTKRMNTRYEREFWPFSWCKEDGQFFYWMPDSIAAKFRSFRNEA